MDYLHTVPGVVVGSTTMLVIEEDIETIEIVLLTSETLAIGWIETIGNTVTIEVERRSVYLQKKKQLLAQ